VSERKKMTIQVNGLFPGELYPDITIGGCIDIFENAWPNPQETIDLIEKESDEKNSSLHWIRAGTIGKGLDQSYRTNYHLGITSSAYDYNNPVAQNVHNQMYLLLLASTIPYAEKHGVPELHHEGYSMLKYSGGQYYDAHADGETYTGRSISAICYLNNDYSGGELEFINFGIKIKPEPGMLILFPSNYAYKHIAHPVTSGTKYAIVTWLKDRKI
jgi:Rps23 Pro-64 3,4-dihydroxylase Tpa1-like proline 4-hydroxylase